MAGKGKGSAQINLNIPASEIAIYNVICERAAALDWSQSQFVLNLLRQWHGQGCPAVSAQDQAMIIAGQMAKAGRKPYPESHAIDPSVNEGKRRGR